MRDKLCVVCISGRRTLVRFPYLTGAWKRLGGFGETKLLAVLEFRRSSLLAEAPDPASPSFDTTRRPIIGVMPHSPSSRAILTASTPTPLHPVTCHPLLDRVKRASHPCQFRVLPSDRQFGQYAHREASNAQGRDSEAKM